MVYCMKKLTFDIQEDLFKLLKLNCFYRNITMKQFLAEAIITKLKEKNNAISMESECPHNRSNPNDNS